MHHNTHLGWYSEALPLLIEALVLLFNTGLDPGSDIIAQLGQGLILRRGQAAVILWRL